MANHLSFLTIDLNGANNMNFDDLKWPKSEAFHITKEMLDSCDINESITFDTISMPKVCDSSPKTKPNVQPQTSIELIRTYTEPKNQSESEFNTKNAADSNDKSQNNMKEDTETRIINTNAEQRCEDEIFGEFVVAMLKKLPLEERKRAKKEIMNILL